MTVDIFDLSIQAEGIANGTKKYEPSIMHGTWNVLNLNTTQASEWGLSTDGWLQFRSASNFYAARYFEQNKELTNYTVETIVNAGAVGNYEIGLAFRIRTATSFYYVALNGGHADWGGKNIRLVRVNGTVHTRIAEAVFPNFEKSKDYQLKVSAIGSQLKVEVNGIEVMNVTDSNPILSGSFGPFVYGQEFAKWKNFIVLSDFSFQVERILKDQKVSIDNREIENAVLVSELSVRDLLDASIKAFLNTLSYNSYNVKRIKISATNPNVQVVFDKVDMKIESTDLDSYIYVYKKTPTTPPLAVNNLVGVAQSPSSIHLTWEHSDTNEDGFYIVDQWNTVIATVGRDVLAYTITGLQENTIITCYVVAFNQAGHSAPSNTVIVTTPMTIPNAPSNLRATEIRDTSITWEWEDVATNEFSFELLDIDDFGVISIVATIPKNRTIWVETNLKPRTRYKRAIRAVNLAGNSEHSIPIIVRTLEPIPDPPSLIPVNFMGIGISKSEIVWSWSDLNERVDGFHIYNEKEEIIKTIASDFNQWIERDLYSAMEYKRKIAAFNAGGVGPSTEFMWAKTLPYGYDEIEVPIAPMNLRVEEIEERAAVISWTYEENPLFPIAGFKLYNKLDEPVFIFDRHGNVRALSTAFKERLEPLTHNTIYEFYLVAYNGSNESPPSNLIRFVTKEEKEEEDVVISDNNYIDPYDGITYDHELMTTPKIKAFQSGVGDGLDLLVQNQYRNTINYEEFDFDIYITGKYRDTVREYPIIPFQYMVLYQNGAITVNTPWLDHTVQYNPNQASLRHKIELEIDPYTERLGVEPNEITLFVKTSDGTYIGEYTGRDNEINWVVEKTYIETDHPDHQGRIKTATISFWTNVNYDKQILREWKGAISKSDKFAIQDSERKTVTARVQSPLYQINWQELDSKYGFDDTMYRVIAISNNANIDVVLKDEILNFFPKDNTFVEIDFYAKIINPAQTPWHPSVHTGYYYLNQREHFLYSKNEIGMKNNSQAALYKYTFPYVIKGFAERFYNNEDAVFEDNTAVEFLLGNYGSDIDIRPLEDKITLRSGVKKGVYLSRILDFGLNIESWMEPIIQQDLNAIKHGAKVTLELGESDKSGNVNEWKTFDTMHPCSAVRYRLTLEEGEEYYTNTAIIALSSYDLANGKRDNITVTNNESLTLADTINAFEGTFISGTLNMGNQIESLGEVSIEAYIPSRTSVNVYTVSYNNPFHDYSKPTTASPWIPATPTGPSTYRINSAINPYLSVIIVLATSTTNSPSVKGIKIKPVLYNHRRIAPTVTSISVGGYIPKGVISEEFTVPMTADVMSDEKWHYVTFDTTKSIVLKYLNENGVNKPEELSFKSFEVKADKAYPIELRYDAKGETAIESRTTGNVEGTWIQNQVLLFDRETQSIQLAPVPQQGSPIIIYNASGILLNPTNFRDEKGNPTLINKEFHVANETRTLFLEYTSYEIDEVTLHVTADLQRNGKYKDIIGCRVHENRLLLPVNLMPDTPVEVQYKLKHSFCSVYNQDKNGASATIYVHTPFDSINDDTRKLEVYYETNKESAYYYADEINLNPLHSKISTGFIYVTDEVFEANHLRVCAHPKQLYRSRQDKVSIQAYVTDVNGNPVVGELVNFEISKGHITIQNNRTDVNGMVDAIYETDPVIKENEIIIKVSVVSGKTSAYFTKEIRLNLIEEKYTPKISIARQKESLGRKSGVQLKLTMSTITNDKLAGKKIVLSSSSGHINPSSELTDERGEIFVEYVPSFDAEGKRTIITATCDDITEQIIL